MQEHIVRAVKHNHPAACRALLPLKSKGALSNTEHGFVQVCAFINNQGVFPAHFANHLLDKFLASMGFARRLDDVKPNSLAAREGNQRGARVAHQCRADRLAGSWHKVQDIARNASLPQDVTHDLGDCWRLLRGLDHCAISSDKRRNCHARTNCQREIPWTDDRCHAARLVPLLIKLADEITKASSTKQCGRFACVILAEVNRFAHIGIRLAPSLSAFANQNR